MVGCEFSGNIAVGMGGGIATEQVASISIADCDIRDNESGTGGGICLTTGPATVEGCTITGNSSPFGGGVAVMSAWDVAVERCDISLNTATSVGGGVYVLDAVVSVSACEIHGNGTGVDVVGTPSAPVAAQSNWWGDASGPYHPLLNPGGAGDSVSDFVDFQPWIGVAGAADDPDDPASLSVYPNPFSASTSVAFALPAAAHVELAIYDASGRIVRTLLDGPMGAGPQALPWDGRDARGARAAAGAYFVALRAGSVFARTSAILLHGPLP